MDRLIHTVLSALATTRDSRLVSAQNLANQTVPGYRRDLSYAGTTSFAETAAGMSPRVFQRERATAAFSDLPGMLDQTGDPMDVAIADAGYFYVAAEGGAPALSRRADLRVNPDGVLVNGAGEQMLDSALAPITLPPFREMVIDDLGRISITPLDGAPGERVQIAMLATVVPEGVALAKGEDGRIRMADGSPLPVPDQRARVLQGVREGSNVNPTEELIASIEIQRGFELGMRMISTAREMDEAGAQLLRMPSR